MKFFKDSIVLSAKLNYTDYVASYLLFHKTVEERSNNPGLEHEKHET